MMHSAKVAPTSPDRSAAGTATGATSGRSYGSKSSAGSSQGTNNVLLVRLPSKEQAHKQKMLEQQQQQQQQQQEEEEKKTDSNAGRNSGNHSAQANNSQSNKSHPTEPQTEATAATTTKTEEPPPQQTQPPTNTTTTTVAAVATVASSNPPTPTSNNPQDYLRHLHAYHNNNNSNNNNQDNTRKAGTAWWERVVVQRSSYVVEDLVEQYTVASQFLQRSPPPVAWLDRVELTTGDLLGAGTYSNVCRIVDIHLLPDFLVQHPVQHALRTEFQHRGQQQPPEQSQSTTTTSGYAMKHLKPELLQNSKLFEAAAADLIMEAKYLSNLNHPNILKLRGMALGGTSTFAATGLFDSYFLVVDELQETLMQRIHLWKTQGSTNQYRPAMVLHKLKLGLQIASALAYLHQRRLVFRDLKPHNIGLKDSTQIQLFDFGFCRELPAATNTNENENATRTVTQLGPEQHDSSSDSQQQQQDQLYYMSGKGTLMYMASEILGTRRYNQKADVYSWSMVVYELLTLQKPFAVGSIEQHKRTVCERGERPPLQLVQRWLPERIQHVLKQSWQANVKERWTMQQVQMCLEEVLPELEQNQSFPFVHESSFSGRPEQSRNNKSVFCNFNASDIILDITNSFQARYGQLFCNTPPQDQPQSPSTTTGSKLQDDAATTKQDQELTGHEVTLPDFLATTNLTMSMSTSAMNMNSSHRSWKENNNSLPALASRCTSASASAGESGDVFDPESMDVRDNNNNSNNNNNNGKRKGQEEQKNGSYSLADMSLSAAMWGGSSARLPKPSEQYLMASMAMSSARLETAASKRSVAMTPVRKLEHDFLETHQPPDVMPTAATTTAATRRASLQHLESRSDETAAAQQQPQRRRQARRASVHGDSRFDHRVESPENNNNNQAVAASIHLDYECGRVAHARNSSNGVAANNRNLGSRNNSGRFQSEEDDPMGASINLGPSRMDRGPRAAAVSASINLESAMAVSSQRAIPNDAADATDQRSEDETEPNGPIGGDEDGRLEDVPLQEESPDQQVNADSTTLQQIRDDAQQASIDTTATSSSRRLGPNPQDDQGPSRSYHIVKTASV